MEAYLRIGPTRNVTKAKIIESQYYIKTVCTLIVVHCCQSIVFDCCTLLPQHLTLFRGSRLPHHRRTRIISGRGGGGSWNWRIGLVKTSLFRNKRSFILLYLFPHCFTNNEAHSFSSTEVLKFSLQMFERVVNFTNILCAAFAPISFCQKNTNLSPK